ncbi:MAG: alkyl hydroperoxide reductase subunit F [Pseudomonadota bacterium]
MLNNQILQSLKAYMQTLTADVALVLQTGEHPQRSKLVDFLSQLVSVSERLSLREENTQNNLRSPISFGIEVDGKNTGVQFSGIPSGHEFNSLVLAILQSAGTPIRLDEHLVAQIEAIDADLHFEVFVSLSCHNCPDVVQAVNQFALINSRISSEMIDGGLFQEEIEQRNIQGVPSVYLNGELFANGKISTGELVAKLVESVPKKASTTVSSRLPLQDVTVIGGGPAGVSSAIYSARKGLKVTLIADRIGGQVKDTMGIENLISVPKTTGPELTGSLYEHLKEYDITIKEHLSVTEVQDDTVKVIKLSSGEEIRSKTLIMATGARWRELGVPGERENIGNGVAYCPHCDGPFFKGKDVAVIGGGNSGVEAALDLAGIVKSVTIVEFAPELKADQILIEQAEKRKNIKIVNNAATQSIEANDGKVHGFVLQDRDSGQTKKVDVDGVFVQIGLIPNSQLVEGLLELTPYGEIVINEQCQTSTQGIFACGDVTTVPYKQIVIAMGEGAKASLAAFEYLLTLDDAQFSEEEIAA